jgi:hypothetical protein
MDTNSAILSITWIRAKKAIVCPEFLDRIEIVPRQGYRVEQMDVLREGITYGENQFGDLGRLPPAVALAFLAINRELYVSSVVHHLLKDPPRAPPARIVRRRSLAVE